MPWAPTNAGEIYYDLQGSKAAPVLVLVRGLAWSSRYWLTLPGRFASSYRVLTLDSRGAGASSAPLGPYSIGAMADDVAAVLGAAGIGRVHLFGLSLGGMIAQQFALRHRDRLGCLVLGATSAGGWLRRPIPAAAMIRLLLSGLLPPPDTARVMAPVLFAQGFRRRQPRTWARWLELAAVDATPRHGAAAQLLAALRHDTHGALPSIEAPTLVMAGAKDRLIPPEHSVQLARKLPNAQLRVLDDSGHEFPTEQPDVTVRIVRGFLNRSSAIG
ncbi:MAG: alpha/beta hydrolase [Proteobacteria bacterium]|nr:alpha/beta hydrolase [Pseudomonadota bacterium]